MDVPENLERSPVLASVDGIFAGTRDAWLAFDRDRRILRWSAALASLTQISPEHALGKTIDALFPDANQRDEHAFEQTLRGAHAHVEVGAWNGKPTFYAPLHGPDGTILGGVAVAKLEHELQTKFEALERSHDALERFAFVAAHDLQEPVRMVASYMRLLADKLDPSLDDSTRRYFAFALDGAVRMRALIDGLLAVARVQGEDSARKQVVSLDEVVREALGLLALAIEESSTQVTTLPLPTLPGQRSQLVQLFQNLIANAIKFRGENPARVSIRCQQTGAEEWLFHVEDNGIGMPMEHAERAFHLLQRVHSRKRYPGGGIGLALCKEVVEHHGGRIWLSSEVGKGTCVSFTLKG